MSFPESKVATEFPGHLAVMNLVSSQLWCRVSPWPGARELLHAVGAAKKKKKVACLCFRLFNGLVSGMCQVGLGVTPEVTCSHCCKTAAFGFCCGFAFVLTPWVRHCPFYPCRLVMWLPDMPDDIQWLQWATSRICCRVMRCLLPTSR